MSRILIIPDVHQELEFLDRIFAEEALESFDRVVFLGDYFDGRSRLAAGPLAAEKTAGFMLRLAEALGDRLTLLCGNHDLPYLQVRETALGDRDARREQILGLTDFMDHAEAINRVWPREFWQRIEMATEADGWLLSHAGFHPEIWPQSETLAAGLKEVAMEWQQLRRDELGGEDHLFLHCSVARGGSDPVGGPLWLDWKQEFVDALPWPQMVGHSRGLLPRRTGRSWCIDCSQSTYVILENGSLEFR